MARILGLLLGVVAVATLLAQGLGLGILWYRGQLTPDNVQDITAILSGEQQEFGDLEDDDVLKQQATEEVMHERSMRILELTSRENELHRLKTMLTEEAYRQLKGEERFKKQKETFDARLMELSDKSKGKATLQVRGVLKALPPAEAVKNLMALDLNDDILILKGMSEKTIAKILKQFSVSIDTKELERGQQIFEKLSNGGSEKTLIDNAARELSQADVISDKK